MFILMIIVFVAGYLCIALEHPLKINKAASALLLGVLLWVLFVIGGGAILTEASSKELLNFSILNAGAGFYDWLVHLKLIELLGEIGQILFFLIGAMTIVELVDSHGGFNMITDKIKTTGKVKLLWVICIITFFMSAALDNLTTSIVMVALLRKLIDEKKDRWFFASMVIIAANSGGAWSPIGDVTTIMLWVANKVTALNIIKMTFLASAMSMIVPLIVLSFILKGSVQRPQEIAHDGHFKAEIPVSERNLFFFVGVGSLLFVPVFKSVTHLPPYLGMVGSLSVLWILTEIKHRRKDEETRKHLSVPHVLTKIDMSTILFFLGILVAVGALQVCGHLGLLAAKLDTVPLGEPSKYYLITIVIGLLSAIVDNVPLVAGAIGMYSFPTDHYFWEFLAYCAGVGGSLLIIGSAAGVAVMGLEKIDFIWYLKRITWIALIGYFAGAATFIVEKEVREKLFGSEHHAGTIDTINKNSVEDYLSKNTGYTLEQYQAKNSAVTADNAAFSFPKFENKTELENRTYAMQSKEMVSARGKATVEYRQNL